MPLAMRRAAADVSGYSVTLAGLAASSLVQERLCGLWFRTPILSGLATSGSESRRHRTALFGLIDLRAQAELPSALRTETRMALA